MYTVYIYKSGKKSSIKNKNFNEYTKYTIHIRFKIDIRYIYDKIYDIRNTYTIQK